MWGPPADRANLVRRRLTLLAILALAAALRLQHIDQPLTDAFSWRQANTAMTARNFGGGGHWNPFRPQMNWAGPTPGHAGRELQTVAYAAALLRPVLGDDDWVGRLVAAAFGVWGVFALYLLVARVWDRRHA